MSNLTTHWRPIPTIRAKSLALIWRDDAILVSAIPDDTGATKGWRPLGGSVEFGERSKETVIRELGEEIQATVKSADYLAVIENIYMHQGLKGHETVFIYTVVLEDAGLAVAEDFIVDDESLRLTRVRFRWSHGYH